MREFFYWMGVIYSGLFLLLGLGVFSGLILNYVFTKMGDIHGMTKLIKALKEAKLEKP